jgi:probable HAF family extracellular repeat protein
MRFSWPRLSVQIGLVSAILLLAEFRVLADPLYSVTDLGSVSQSDTSVGSIIGRMINIDQAGNVSYLPSGGMLNWSGAVPSDDRPMWQMEKGSDNGQYVVGTAERTVEPFFWDAYTASGGSAMAIGRVFPSSHEQFSAAYAVNNSGKAVGIASDVTTNAGGAFLYTPGKGAVLIPGTGAAYGINNLGQVVGGFHPDQATTTWHAFLSNNGQTSVDLNTLIPSSSKWTLTTATGINDKGQIVSYGVDDAGTPHALLLTPDGGPSPEAPVPEPSLLAFFGLVAAAMALRRVIGRARGPRDTED